MFGYIRIIAYLNEKEPNYHVQRFMQAWNLGGKLFRPKIYGRLFQNISERQLNFHYETEYFEDAPDYA